MLGPIRYIIVVGFMMVIFATTLAPALSRVISTLQNVFITTEMTSGVIGNTTTFLFIGMPLLFVSGAILVGFFVAVGLRGTSFR